MSYTPEAKVFARKLTERIEQDKAVPESNWALLRKLLSI